MWSENTVMHFDERGNECSAITEHGEGRVCDIKVVSIDSLEECSSATYIKMDIEGAEANALKGAENIIKKNHPKLAISIYHKDEDMIELPLYIHELVPQYRMYIRQHSHTFFDTVLYCVDTK